MGLESLHVIFNSKSHGEISIRFAIAQSKICNSNYKWVFVTTFCGGLILYEGSPFEWEKDSS